MDEQLSSRYLACCLNYERYICSLFGKKHSLGEATAFTLQFRDIMAAGKPDEATAPLPSSVARYVTEFDASMSEGDLGSPHYRMRILFTPLVTSAKTQANEVIQFVPYDSEMGQSINQTFLREVERPKHLPSAIVEKMRREGYFGFNMHHHTQLWKSMNAKNPGKGYGVMVGKTWYWYDRWVEVAYQHCRENGEMFKAI